VNSDKKKKDDRKAVLESVCLLNVWYRIKGTNENKRGNMSLKIHVRSMPDTIEQIGANMLMLSIALYGWEISEFQKELLFVKLA
jgi:hypothetical protein